MRNALLLSASLACCAVASAQIASAQIVSDDMADDFKAISKYGSRQSGFENLQTYHTGHVEGNQFFNPNWSPGSITTTSNQQFGNNLLFLYDKVRQQLFLKWKDSSVVLLADKNLINTFTLSTDRTHSFVTAAVYDPGNKGNFFEVLVKNDKGYSLFKLTKTKFVKADERDMEKQKLGDIYDSFVDEITYYLVKDNVVKAVALRKNSVLKALPPPFKDKVSTFFNQHSDNSVDESLLIGAIEFLNS
jgi:hypothetical protein